MIELELLGTGADGQSLVLTDAEGERYSVPVTDELRGAVRRDRPRLETVPAPQARPLRPGEIQALLRSGLTAEELARESSMDIAHIRRFEAPVAAEKEWALQRALTSHVGGDRDAPVMGDLVVDRLAARGVDPSSLSWSARRPAEGPWEIALTFLQGAAEHAAHWTLAPSASAVEAIDQEARWLTETAAPSPVSAVFTPLSAPSAEPRDEGVDDARARESLIDQLNAARGHRQGIDIPLDMEDDEDLTQDEPSSTSGPQPGSLSARIHSLAHARTRPSSSAARPSGARPADVHEGDSPSSPMSRPKDMVTSAGPGAERDADIDSTSSTGGASSARGAAASGTEPGDSGPGSANSQATPNSQGTPDSDSETLPGMEDVPRSARPERERKRGRRRSVPSWDEIVFGSKPQ